MLSPTRKCPVALHTLALESATSYAWWSDKCWYSKAGVLSAFMTAGENSKPVVAFGVIPTDDLKACGILWSDAKIVGEVLPWTKQSVHDSRSKYSQRTVCSSPPSYNGRPRGRRKR